MDNPQSVDNKDFNFETMDIKSVLTLSFVMWAIGFIKTKDHIKKGDDMDHPGEEEIKKLYVTSGNHPDDVAIHYEPCWGNTYFCLSVKDADGVYQPLASIETRMPTCDMCSLGATLTCICFVAGQTGWSTIPFTSMRRSTVGSLT